MKIAIDLTSLCRPITGTERVAIEMTKAIIHHSQHQYILIFRQQVHSDFSENNPETTRILSPFKSQFLTEQLWLPYLINKIKPDLTFFPFFPPGWFFKMPFTILIHDANMWLNLGTLSLKTKAYTKPLIERALRKANKILVTSPFYINDLIRLTSANISRIEQVGIGISHHFAHSNYSFIKTYIRDNLTLEIKSRYCLAVGTIEPRKNYLGLVKAVHLIRNWFEKNDVKLVIVGRFGWGAHDVQKAINSYGLHKIVKIVGHIQDDVLANFYTHADSFLFTSFYEGYGLPVIEAMSCGCPVLCSNIEPLNIIAKDAAYFVDPKNSVAIANGIIKISEDELLRKKLIKNGYQIANQHSWESVGERFVEAVKRIHTTTI